MLKTTIAKVGVTEMISFEVTVKKSELDDDHTDKGNNGNNKWNGYGHRNDDH